jgi:general secretion pathway protein H
MTLLEALVVVAISVIVAMLAFPGIERALDILSLREASGALAANLQVARGDALKTGRDLTFTIGGDGKSYGWDEGETRRVPGAIELRMSKGSSIIFYADGATSGGTVTASADGRQTSITVDQATGAVLSGQ